VTYPIVTALLAAPHVKAVRAQTMFEDSYVFVVFEDGTDIYWARSRVLADLRSAQDWLLRYQLETVPGVAEVASIGGFVRQYQVRLDPDKLRAYHIPLSTVIDRVQQSTNEVGGRILELSGAQYMIRGLGYLRNLSDLETVPVASNNGVPVMVKDVGAVA